MLNHRVPKGMHPTRTAALNGSMNSGRDPHECLRPRAVRRVQRVAELTRGGPRRLEDRGQSGCANDLLDRVDKFGRAVEAVNIGTAASSVFGLAHVLKDRLCG